MLTKGPPTAQCRMDLYKTPNNGGFSIRTMERFVLVTCVVLLFLVLLGSVSSLSDYELLELHKSHEKKHYSPFYPWFASKHRQKREPMEEEYSKYPELDRQHLSSWLLALNNDAGRRFFKRINRESNDNDMSFANERWLDIDVASRSPPFAPRLGRRNMPFIPRLGRDIDRLAFI